MEEEGATGGKEKEELEWPERGVEWRVEVKLVGLVARCTLLGLRVITVALVGLVDLLGEGVVAWRRLVVARSRLVVVELMVEVGLVLRLRLEVEQGLSLMTGLLVVVGEEQRLLVRVVVVGVDMGHMITGTRDSQVTLRSSLALLPSNSSKPTIASDGKLLFSTLSQACRT